MHALFSKASKLTETVIESCADAGGVMEISRW